MGSTNAPGDSYKLRDRVFAKIRGYPYWPAQITERRPGPAEEYCVAFYGSHEIAYVKPNNLVMYNEDAIEKYAAGFSAVKNKKPTRNSILTFQKAMEECAANIDFIPVDVDIPAEEEEAQWEQDSPSPDVDPLAATESVNIPEVQPVVDPLPRRGRPPKAVALKNRSIPNNSDSGEYNNQQLNTNFLAESTLPTNTDDDVPFVVTSVESLSNKIFPEQINSGRSSVEEIVEDMNMDPPSEQNGIISRSGRKIKPKKFADSDVELPFQEYLKSAVNTSKSPVVKRKASFDGHVEVAKKIALDKQILTMPMRRPRKSLSASIDEEVIDDELQHQECSDDMPQIISVRSGNTKHRFLASVGGSNISWKEEAMRSLQDKLINSCKRIENFQKSNGTIGSLTIDSLISSPVRDKLVSASVPPLNLSAAALTQPAMSKSMGAIAKVVAGDSSKKARSSARKSVGTSTSELKELFPSNNKVTSVGTEQSLPLEPVATNITESPEKDAGVESVSGSDHSSPKHHSLEISPPEELQVATTPEDMLASACSLPNADTPKRVTFGGTMTQDANDNNKRPNSIQSNVNPETPVVPSSIMKKPRTEALEAKLTPSGRSHLQRKVEAPLRYKDTVTSPKDIVKASPSGKFAKTKDSSISSNEDASVNGNGMADDVDSSVNQNGLKVLLDSEDDEPTSLTEDDFLDDQTKQRFKMKAKEKDVMEAVVKLVNSAMESDHNLDLALEMLVKLSDPDFVDRVIMKKYPEIVHVVRKMVHFVGNPKVVKLTKLQKADFPLKTEKIREQAQKTLDSYKELMSTNTKPLAVLIMEEMRRKNSET